MERIKLLAFTCFACAVAAQGATNQWVRRPGADPKVSTAANWSLGHAPKADEVALFSGRHASAAVWDAAAPREIGGLATEESYVSVISFESGPDLDFKTLKINGDLDLRGGALTHPECGDSAKWWLSLDVAGNVSVVDGALISASAKGFAPGKGPSPGIEAGWGASHGGQGAPREMAEVTRPALTYDSIRDPRLPGSGGTVKDGVSGGGFGGGVIRIKAGGDVVISGAVRADGDQRDIGEGATGGAAGGSIRIDAGGRIDVSGEHSVVSARGGEAYHDGGGGGGGGRIAFYTGELKTGVIVEVPWTQQGRGHVSVNGGTGDVQSKDSSTRGNVKVRRNVRGASGTVYVEFTGEGGTPGGGTVSVYGWQRPSMAATRLPSDACDDPRELADVTLVLDGGSFVTLSGMLSVRRAGFRDVSMSSFDLNGSSLVVGELWTGVQINQDRSNVITEPRVYSDPDPDIPGSVIFNGGRVEVRPYFKPTL